MSAANPATVRVGIDVGGTKCLAVALAGADVVAEARRPTPAAGELVDAIAEAAAEAAAGAGAPIASVGVGLPGLVDRDGVLRFAPNVRGVADLAVSGPLADRLGVPVHADNDATCAAWAEVRAGAARGHDDVVVVTIGTGIGGGLVLGGRLQRGAHGFAGEIGHLVVDPAGPPCPCGRRGCWERFASGSGLGRLGREAAAAGLADRVQELAGGDPDAVRGEHVSAAAREGSADGLAIFAAFAGWLAAGLADLVLTLDPELVVLGGGLVDELDLVLPVAQARLGELLPGRGHRPVPALVAATLGEQAGAIGAGLLDES